MAIKQQSTSRMLAGLGRGEKKPVDISAETLIGAPGEPFDAPQLKLKDPKLKSAPDYEAALINSLRPPLSKKPSPTDK
jgi:hypothetical protein